MADCDVIYGWGWCLEWSLGGVGEYRGYATRSPGFEGRPGHKSEFPVLRYLGVHDVGLRDSAVPDNGEHVVGAIFRCLEPR
jgi:hypothetical protein